MSRVGKKPVTIPDKVKVSVNGRVVSVEGPLGKLDFEMRPEISAVVDEEAKTVQIDRLGETRLARALHGTYRALIQNMVVGVTQGYEKKLEIQGVGYIGAVQGRVLQLRVGFANELHAAIPEGVEVVCPDQQHIHIKGIDKQKVSHFAASVRALRKPEPYNGKGIRYEGEQVRRKEGKAAAK